MLPPDEDGGGDRDGRAPPGGNVATVRHTLPPGTPPGEMFGAKFMLPPPLPPETAARCNLVDEQARCLEKLDLIELPIASLAVASLPAD